MERLIVAPPNDTSNMMSYTLVALHENVAVSSNMTVWFCGGVGGGVCGGVGGGVCGGVGGGVCGGVGGGAATTAAAIQRN